MRYRTVLVVETCLLAGGALAFMAAWQDPAVSDGALGALGLAAAALAAVACVRRSWARVPLGASSMFGALTAFTALTPRAPGEIVGFAYAGLGLLMVLATGMALVVTIVEHDLTAGR
jgi:hypothetical protein